jgi:hypothetical protein
VLAVASVWLRPLWPVDETRYASVAWEMWLRGDFLVPYINGEPYSHKPPLLFWLIHRRLGGIRRQRLVAAPRRAGCARLAALPLIRTLARLLWPEEREPADHAAWTLFGTLLFAAFVTLLMFDLLLLLCTMAAMIGVLRAARGETRAGILWLAAGDRSRSAGEGTRDPAARAARCSGCAVVGARAASRADALVPRAAGRDRARCSDCACVGAARGLFRRRSVPARDFLGPDGRPGVRVVRASRAVVVLRAAAASDPLSVGSCGRRCGAA